MAIKPQPAQIQCRHCGWKTLYAPLSDALVMPPPESCEKCGSEELDSRPVGIAKNLLTSISSLLKRH